jgi:RimJ/RimL family protein N-acetyltransferase
MTTIRQFTAQDWQAARDIRLQALKTNPTVFSFTYEKALTLTEQDWKQRLSDPNTGIFGLIDDTGKCIGMTGVAIRSENPQDANLWGSWIHPDHRGKGYSDLLYKARIDWARQKGLKRITVSHRESNKASFRANQRHGFTFVRQEDTEWNDGVIEPELFYELVL